MRQRGLGPGQARAEGGEKDGVFWRGHVKDVVAEKPRVRKDFLRRGEAAPSSSSGIGGVAIGIG